MRTDPKGVHLPEQSPTTRTKTISEVKKSFTSLVNELGHGTTRVPIEEAGIPVAALVSVNDLARLDRFDREWEEGTKAIQRFSRAFADVPVEEAEAEIARIIAKGRQRRAAEAEPQTA